MCVLAELVTLDGLTLSGRTREGLWKVQTPMPGWFNRPSPKTRSEPRVRGDGGFRTPVEYGSRQITINGLVESSNHDYLHQAVEQINAAGFRGSANLLVAGHGATQWATVDPRPGSEIDTEFLTDRMLRFQIPLEAIDPFKYGEEHTELGTPGSPASLFHRGTVPAWPVVTVSGASASGYLLTLNGRTVTVTRSLVSGSPHTLDFRTGILRIGGAVVAGGIGAASFGPIPPGLPRLMTTNAGAISVKYFDTFI